MDDSLERFSKAIVFIKQFRKIESNKAIAEILHISPSYLSQILKGKKPLTPAIIKTFETAFVISLVDPFSFIDLNTIGLSEGFTKETFNTLLQRVRTLLIERSKVVEAQEKLIASLYNERKAMIELFYNKEAEVIETYKPGRKGNSNKMKNMLLPFPLLSKVFIP